MGYMNLDGEIVDSRFSRQTKDPEDCNHKDDEGKWTVIILEGQYEQCTQCGLIGK